MVRETLRDRKVTKRLEKRIVKALPTSFQLFPLEIGLTDYTVIIRNLNLLSKINVRDC